MGNDARTPQGALTRNRFAVLAALAAPDAGAASQRELARRTGLSLGTVNAALRELRRDGLVDQAGAVTQAGREALEPYRVRNAVIMAAGMSTRFAPLSFERPKGVLKVKGEVLIERQIRQLQEAGITDITVVVGYMKEQFFYLEDRFGCTIRVNDEYTRRNNNSTLMLVAQELGNTYICSSDNYFAENVFEPYVYQSYYAATFFPGPTAEYLLETGSGKRITAVQVGGSDGYGMLGHAYFDREFAQRFCEILRREYDLPETAPKLWEDIYAAHVDELPMVMRPYEAGVVWEFDSLGELQAFDEAFVENVDSSILDNICGALGCGRTDITGIETLSRGVSNLSFKFEVEGEPYVYRHPCEGPGFVIDRAAEAAVQQVARRLGLDGTFIHEDAEAGWKLSRYVPGCTYLDYRDPGQVAQVLAMLRTLHGSGEASSFTYDLYGKAQRLVELLGPGHRASFPDFRQLQQAMDDLAARLRAEDGPLCLCHNDCYDANLLVAADGTMHLIDWEYAGMADYAGDLGTFICCSDYTYDEALAVLRGYFQREPTAAELAHCLAFIALAAYHWFVWALYKDSQGNPVGEWLYRWYRYAKEYSALALEAYEGGAGA